MRKLFSKFPNLTKSQRITAVILVIIVIVLPLVVIVAQKRQQLLQHASSSDDPTQALTDQLVALNTERVRGYVQGFSIQTLITGFRPQLDEAANTQITSEMAGIAQVRKQTLLQVAVTDPQRFLQHATLASLRGSYPPNVQQYLEQKTELQGSIIGFHSDDFADKKSINSFALKTATGVYSLAFANDQEAFSTQQAKVSGVVLDTVMVADSSQQGALQISQTARDATTSLSGPLELGVFIIRFQDSPQAVVDMDRLRGMFLTDTNSFKSYYERESFGRVSISADFYPGPYTIPFNEPNDPNYQCPTPQEMSDYHDALLQLLPAQGVDLSQYTDKVYIFTGAFSNCHSEAGAGTGVDASHRESWQYKPNYVLYDYIHEFGHTMGLFHANLLPCGDRQIDQFEGGSCYIAPAGDEYGDHYDPMGAYGVQSFFNSAHQDQLGWLNSSEKQTVSTSGIYTVVPLGAPALSGVKTLLLSKTDTQDTYYVDYRQPVSLDQTVNINSNVFSGIQVHIGSGSQEYPHNPTTRLLEMHPNATSQEALGDSYSFTDPFNHIVVQQVCHNENKVVLKITLNDQPVSDDGAAECAGITVVPTPTPTPIIPTKPPLNQPTPTPTPIPTTVFSPPTIAPTTAGSQGSSCSPRPNIMRSVTANNRTKTVFVVANVGISESMPVNEIRSIRFTNISNASVNIGGKILANDSSVQDKTITFPQGTQTVTFNEIRTPGVCAPVTVNYIWADDCGNFSDFSGAGTGALDCSAPSFPPD